MYFSKYHQGIKRTHTCFNKIIFETGARLKKPVYVCIGRRFSWEIYFLLLHQNTKRYLQRKRGIMSVLFNLCDNMLI